MTNPRPVPRLVLASLVIFLFFPLLAQASALRLSEVVDGAPLGRSITFFDDADNLWSIDDARKSVASNEFSESQNETLAFGYTDSSYWFHLLVLNDTREPQTRFFQVGYPLLDRVDLYSDCDGSVSQFKTGDHLEFDERPISHRTFLFPLEMAPGQKCDLFLKVQTTSAMQVPIAIWDPIRLFEEDQTNIAAIMGLGGVLGIMAVYNLLILFSVRRRVYFYYVGFVLSILFVVLALNGASFQFFWPGSTWLADHSVGFLIPCTGFFVTRFTIEYLSMGATGRADRASYRYLKLVSNVLLVMAFLTLFVSYAETIRPILLVEFVTAILCVTVGGLNWRAGSREAMLYMVSWLVFLVGALAIILAKLGLVATTAFTENGLALGTGLQVALLSFALADQLKAMERAKTKAERKAGELQQNLNAELESKLYLFSSVAHELNNPLNYISLGSDGLKSSALNLTGQVESIFVGVEKTPEVQQVSDAFSAEFGAHAQSLQNLQTGVRKVAEVISEMRGLTGVDGDSWYPITLSESLEQAIERLHDALDPGRIDATPFAYQLNGCEDFSCRVNPYLVVHAFRLVLLDAFDPSKKDRPTSVEVVAQEKSDGVDVKIIVNQTGRDGLHVDEEQEPVRIARQLIAQIGGELRKEQATPEKPVDHYHLKLDFKASESSI